MILQPVHPRLDGAFEGKVTLDQVVRKLATSKGAELAVIDPSDRPAFTDGAPKRLTWSELDARAETFARCLTGLGLAQDSVVAIQLPNTVDHIVALTGTLRAGMIAALVPLGWRQRDLTWALRRVNAVAAITCVRAGPADHTRIMMDAAVENFGLRFICSFGRSVPDGVLPLDEALQENWPAMPPLPARDNAADHVAVITFDATRDGFVPVPRSHNSLITAGLAHLIETRLNAGDTIATALLPSSLAGLATGLISTLLSGAPLLLHHPFTSSALSGAILAGGASHIVLPAIVADAMDDKRLPSPPLLGLTAVRRSFPATGGVPRRTPRVTCLALGEIGLYLGAADEFAAGIPEGILRAPRSGPGTTTLIESRCSADGAIEVRGPLAPAGEWPGALDEDAQLAFDPEGWVATGWRGQMSAPFITPSGERTGIALIGGQSLATAPSLQAVHAALGCDADAVRFLGDPVMGTRLSIRPGAVRDAARVLREAGFNLALVPASPASGKQEHSEVA